jgi:type III secretion system FlhB-like substrate exporter
MRKKAIALFYEKGLSAPLVTAKGAGAAAEWMEAIARGSGVPVVGDPAAAEALFPLGVGETIPERYYKAVALILAAVMTIEEEER